MISLFSSDGVQLVWHEPGHDCHSECILLTVRRGGGTVMAWGLFGNITLTDSTMNGCGYTKILADKMTPSQQKLGRKGKFQCYNDPKRCQNHTRVSKE
uniref:Uncharacterized protein n=1 Tax=Acanthochromis polyacanthus TaxID=80966 RepID=A0A3Q1EGW8_9TELE